MAIVMLLIFGWLLLEKSFAYAEVTTAITQTKGLGDLGTRVTTQGQVIQITGGTRSDNGSGTNLFHSFDQFTVGSGDIARFSNTTPSLHTNNILSRVTGGNPSSIFGTVDTTSYPGASLFLMNPAGVVFGPNATLNVSGSMAFTTANYLRLADANGSIFDLHTKATSLLTSASVAAFGFLGPNPAAAIEVQPGTTLTLKPGRSMSLVGGNVTIQSSAVTDKADSSAPGNRISIGSIASPGELLTENLLPAANTLQQVPETFGIVRISDGSKIDTSNQDGGMIRIRGGQLIVDDSQIFSGSRGISIDTTSISLKNPSALIGTYTTNTAHAGDIVIRAARDIEIDTRARVESQTFTPLKDAGNIRITTTQGNVLLSNRASITSQAFDGGRNVGSIEINAQNGDVRLGNSTIFPTAIQGSGTMGGVKIIANNLKLERESRIDSDNTTPLVAGPIDIQVRNLLQLTGRSEIETSAILGNSRATDIIIKATLVRVLEGSKLSADTTPSSSGSGGMISIRGLPGMHNSVLVDGAGSGIFTGTEGSGPSGTIDILTQSLTLQNGGTISAETSGTAPSATGGGIIITASDQLHLNNGASITARTNGPGSAGNILVKANDITVSGGSSLTASSTGTGNAGTVTIHGLQNPAHSLLIDGVDSGIFTRTSNTGTGGDIVVSANSVRMLNHSSISGETSGTTATATGGKIRVEGDTIRIENGALMTSSSTGAGSGGNIKLTAGQSVSIFDGASVSASSTGTGAAGNIEIDAGLELDVQGGSITTQSTELSGGNIDIRAIDLLRVVDGKISTSAINGGGNGGAITIDPKVVLLQNSDILAQANRGNGGDISITTPVFVADQSSRVDASTPFGLNGRITIQSPTSNLSSTVGQLVSKTTPHQVLLQNRCVALAGGEQSTFLLAGRDALPGEPSGWLSSPVTMEHWTGEETAHAAQLIVQNQTFNSSSVMAAQQNKPKVLSLRRLTPPGFLVRTFVTGATGCPS